MEQAMFRAAYFLALSSCYRGKQSYPKQGCLVTQGAAELPCCPDQRRTTLRPEPPVCRIAATASSVSPPTASLLSITGLGRLGVADGGVAMTYAELGLK